MKTQLPLAISSDADLTFENYYQINTAAVIVSALKQFYTSSSELLIFLWGESGCGISHLLNAVQNDIDNVSVQYLPLKDLIEYPPRDILESLEQLDLICIDDIELASGHAEWQEGLFYLFNRLRDNGKKLLVGGHTSPSNLDFSLSDLTSRMQWGLTLHLPTLDDEDKKQALQFCSKQLGMKLSNEVANFLLQRTERSTGALFDLLKRLDHASLAEQRKLTIPFVKSVIAQR